MNSAGLGSLMLRAGICPRLGCLLCAGAAPASRPSLPSLRVRCRRAVVARWNAGASARRPPSDTLRSRDIVFHRGHWVWVTASGWDYHNARSAVSRIVKYMQMDDCLEGDRQVLD